MSSPYLSQLLTLTNTKLNSTQHFSSFRGHPCSLAHASGSGKDLYFLLLSDYDMGRHSSSLDFSLPREIVMGQASAALRGHFQASTFLKTLVPRHDRFACLPLDSFSLRVWITPCTAQKWHSKDRKKKNQYLQTQLHTLHKKNPITVCTNIAGSVQEVIFKNSPFYI